MKLMNIIVVLLFTVNVYGSEDYIFSDKDNACGPRCLRAILKLDSDREVGIHDIYNILEKKLFAVTTFEDLKYVAVSFGYEAEAYKNTINKLYKYDGYLIIPVRTSNDANTPLHFVLFQRASKKEMWLIDTKTLTRQLLSLAKLKDIWDGYVLVIKDAKTNRTKAGPESTNMIMREKSKKSADNFHDFGKVETGRKLRHTFKIQDKDRIAEAKVVKKNCSCLSAGIQKDEDDYLISMEMMASEAGSQEVYADVMLWPSKRVRRYTMKTYGIDHYILSPKVAYIEVHEGDIGEYPVQIKYFTDKKSSFKYDHTVNTLTELKVIRGDKKVVENSNGTVEIINNFTLKYDIKNSDIARETKSTIDFVFEKDGHPLHIPMECFLKIYSEKFRLTPEKVFIIAQNNKKTVKKCTLEILEKPFPDEITIENNYKFPLSFEVSNISEGKYLIEIACENHEIPGIKKGLHKMILFLNIQKDGKSQKIELPMSVFIRDDVTSVVY